MIRFSRTVSSLSSVSSCGTTPSLPRIAGPSRSGSMPSTCSVPSVTGETQPIIRIVELLPAPFGPRKPNASPRLTSTSMPSTATRLPNRFTRPRALINGVTVRTLLPGYDTRRTDFSPALPSQRAGGLIPETAGLCLERDQLAEHRPVRVFLGHRVRTLQLRLDLPDPAVDGGPLQPGQGHGDIAGIGFAVVPQRFHGQLPDQGFRREIGGGFAYPFHPVGAGGGRRGSPGGGDRLPYGGVHRMPVRRGVDRVEERAGEHRQLDRQLQGLPFHDPLRAVRRRRGPGLRSAVVPRSLPSRMTGSTTARVLTGGGDRAYHRFDLHAEVAGERPQRGLLTGGVPVEGEDDLAGELVGVHQQPPQYADVLGPERRTAARHGGRHVRQVAGHHVGVALHHHGPALLGDLPLGALDAVQHGGLLVDRALGGVEVLRTVVVVEESPRAEADHLAAQLPDRPQQAPPEPVDQVARARLLGQPSGDQLLGGVAPRPQVLGEGVPRVGCEAALVALRDRPVEPPLVQEVPRDPRLGPAQLLLEVRRRVPVRRQQPLPQPGLAVRRTAARGVFVPQRDAGLGGEPLDRLREAEVLHVHHEADRVPAIRAAMAEVDVPGGGDVEARRLLVVERAQALEVVDARRLEGDVLADHLGDGGALAYQGDVRVPDPTSHRVAHTPLAGLHPASRRPPGVSGWPRSDSGRRRPGVAGSSGRHGEQRLVAGRLVPDAADGLLATLGDVLDAPGLRRCHVTLAVEGQLRRPLEEVLQVLRLGRVVRVRRGAAARLQLRHLLLAGEVHRDAEVGALDLLVALRDPAAGVALEAVLLRLGDQLGDRQGREILLTGAAELLAAPQEVRATAQQRQAQHRHDREHHDLADRAALAAPERGRLLRHPVQPPPGGRLLVELQPGVLRLGRDRLRVVSCGPARPGLGLVVPLGLVVLAGPVVLGLVVLGLVVRIRLVVRGGPVCLAPVVLVRLPVRLGRLVGRRHVLPSGHIVPGGYVVPGRYVVPRRYVGARRRGCGTALAAPGLLPGVGPQRGVRAAVDAERRTGPGRLVRRAVPTG